MSWHHRSRLTLTFQRLLTAAGCCMAQSTSLNPINTTGTFIYDLIDWQHSTSIRFKSVWKTYSPCKPVHHPREFDSAESKPGEVSVGMLHRHVVQHRPPRWRQRQRHHRPPRVKTTTLDSQSTPDLGRQKTRWRALHFGVRCRHQAEHTKARTHIYVSTSNWLTFSTSNMTRRYKIRWEQLLFCALPDLVHEHDIVRQR